MSENPFTESVIEQAALSWLERLGYQVFSGLEIAPGELAAERENYGQVILEQRVHQALQRLNPAVPSDAMEEAFRKLIRPDSPSLVASNHVIHKYLVEGVPVEYQRADGSIGGDLVRVLDVYQRPAIGGDGTEKRRHRERHHLDRFQPASDLQNTDSVTVRVQRSDGDLRRRASANRHPHG